MGISSHLPHRDSGLLISGTDTDWSKRIFEADVQAIKSADLIIGVLNGPKADDGAAWELGYAYALRKPIIALIEDLRIRVINNINPMLLNSVKLTRSISELKAALADYVKR
jgi:nucleoside 2-deoxyribosyltransferase